MKIQEMSLPEEAVRKTSEIRIVSFSVPFTYDHRYQRARRPVRSALFKLVTGRLVVRWVTTSEYLLLYVFLCLKFLGWWLLAAGSVAEAELSGWLAESSLAARAGPLK
jgi:hypothetical protein